MESTFKWVFEGVIPPGMSGDQLLQAAGELAQQHPELKMRITEFDNKPAQAVINLPPKAEAEMKWIENLPWT